MGLKKGRHLEHFGTYNNSAEDEESFRYNHETLGMPRGTKHPKQHFDYFRRIEEDRKEEYLPHFR